MNYNLGMEVIWTLRLLSRTPEYTREDLDTAYSAIHSSVEEVIVNIMEVSLELL